MILYHSKSKAFTFLALFFCVFTIHAQDILWEKSYGGKHAEYLFDAIPTPDYGFILAGSSISNKNGNKSDESKGNFDYWLWKMNEHGDQEWQKSFGGSGEDHLLSVALTNDGGFILGGISASGKDGDKKEDRKGQFDFWILKLDAKGGEMWQRTIGGNGQEKLYSIAATKDGGYIIGGTSSSDKTPLDTNGKEDKFGKSEPSRGNLDYWIVKLNSSGNIEWQKTLGGIYADELKSIQQTKDEGYIVGGYSNSPKSDDKSDDNFGEGDFWIIKLDKKGILQWEKTIGASQDDNLFALSQTLDGGFILGGNSNSGASNSKTKSNGKGSDFWVVKLDEDGSITWQETYDFGKLDILTSIEENIDGTYLIGGFAQSEASDSYAASGVPGKLTKTTDREGINDYIALKISNTGENIWSKKVGSKGDEVLRKLIETRDGGYVLAGTSTGGASRDKNSSNGDSDFWVVKLKDRIKPEKVKVDIEAYPNPAENFTNTLVNYDYEDGWAILYDLNGRLLQKTELHGEHTIPIQLGNIPSGVYIINIKTNRRTDSVKIIKK